MKKVFLVVLGVLSIITLSADSDILKATVSDMLGTKSYAPSGVFYQHDFEPIGSSGAFDWAFRTPGGDDYQLQGELPTDDNLFGWKKVDTIENISPEWFMIRVGDTDGDGLAKFDWVMLSTDIENKAIYKLEGVAENGTFDYSNKMLLNYNVTYPESSTVLIINDPSL